MAGRCDGLQREIPQRSNRCTTTSPAPFARPSPWQTPDTAGNLFVLAVADRFEMMSPSENRVFVNPARNRDVVSVSPSSGGSPIAFHRRLPGYAPTRVVDAFGIAR